MEDDASRRRIERQKGRVRGENTREREREKSEE